MRARQVCHVPFLLSTRVSPNKSHLISSKPEDGEAARLGAPRSWPWPQFSPVIQAWADASHCSSHGQKCLSPISHGALPPFVYHEAEIITPVILRWSWWHRQTYKGRWGVGIWYWWVGTCLTPLEEQREMDLKPESQAQGQREETHPAPAKTTGSRWDARTQPGGMAM